MTDQREFCYDYIDGNDYATITASIQKWINKVKREKEKYPDKVHIIAENPDGSIVAHVPPSFSFGIRKEREMTEEQREAARVRLEKARLSKSN